MKFKLQYHKAAVLAYCAAFNLGAKHKRAMKHGVEVLRLSVRITKGNEVLSERGLT